MAEILAPAGNLESVYAAVRCGASAVYLAGESFNARRNAENLSFEQLREAVQYCHAHGVKVYHALNTLVKDSEFAELETEIERILSLGEDALILQDLGVAAVVRRLCPQMPLHASTQLSVHTLGGVQALETMGFRRVVLSRELSRSEIEHIRRHTSLELEVFVHGALCMCVSGQCYFSAFLGARSGNRGLCAQPCRLPISAPGGTGHDLSLKDQSLLRYLPEMEHSGIDSFKIEGRMKRAEYVAAAVTACKAALSGTYTSEQEAALKSIFSRQGFTDGYYTAHRDKKMFGTRTKEDVTAANAKLLKKYASLYQKEVGTVPLTLRFYLAANEAPVLEMDAAGAQVRITGSVKPELAEHRALTKEDLAQRLSKLGGTAFFAQKIQVNLEDGLMLPASEINKLRREGAQALNAAMQTQAFDKIASLPALPKKRLPTQKQLYLRFATVEQAKGAQGDFDKIILPLEQAKEALAVFGTQKVVFETPRVFFGAEDSVITLLEQAKQAGCSEIAAGNIAALHLANQMGFRTLAFFGSNVFNSYAMAQIPADEILLSAEMTTAQINAVRSEKPFGAIVYGHLPLMITRTCPLRNGTSCDKCDKKGFLTDRKGEKLPVRCRFGASEIFNAYALYMADREQEIQTDFSLLYFTVEPPKQVRHILELYRKKAAPDFKFTRGLYAKGVL